MEESKKALGQTSVASLLSGLGSATAACCVGPGIVGCTAICASACASSCTSIAYSAFGLSSSGFIHWLQEYNHYFLVASILFFALAFIQIRKGKENRFSKPIFLLSLFISTFAYGYSVWWPL